MQAGIVTYRRNPMYSDHNCDEHPRLFAELDLSRLGIDARVRGLPVYYQVLDQPVGSVRVIYSTTIAGLHFEAGNLSRMERIITDMVKVLIRFEKLPEYVFQVGENAWPIYQLQDELVTRYPGGPVFNASDISNLRVWLAEHFKELGRIHHRREMDLLALSPYDLQLYAPCFVLRVPGESIPDIPVFPVPGEKSLQVAFSVNRESITMAYDHPTQILEIQAEVGDRLVAQGVLQNRLESTIRKLSLETWETLLDSMAPYEQTLSYTRIRDEVRFREILPVYRHEDLLVAGRVNRIQRVVLYCAANLDDLIQRVSQDLHYYGAIESPGEVRLQSPGRSAGWVSNSLPKEVVP